MREIISALMDGELDDHNARQVMDALKRDTEMQKLWSSYHIIGDALRRQATLTADYAERVMDQLKSEPTVMAPVARRSSSPYRLAMPIAASVAGLGVVAWLALSINDEPQMPNQAAVSQPVVVANAPTAAAPAPPVAVSLPSSAIHQYLAAHQGYSASSSIQGMAPYMRTVTEKRQAVAR